MGFDVKIKRRVFEDRLKFRLAKNGYVVSFKECGETQYIVGVESNDEVDGFIDFLREVEDRFGPTSSKYSPKRVAMLWVPGNDFEPHEYDEKYFKDLAENIDYLYMHLRSMKSAYRKLKKLGAAENGAKESDSKSS